MTPSKPAPGLTQPTEGEISDEALDSIDGGVGRAFTPSHAPRSWSDVIADPDLVVPHDLSPEAQTQQIASNDAAKPVADADPAQKPVSR